MPQNDVSFVTNSIAEYLPRVLSIRPQLLQCAKGLNWVFSSFPFAPPFDQIDNAHVESSYGLR